MDPLDLCPTAADIPNFYNYLVSHLDDYIEFIQPFNGAAKEIIKCGKTSKELMDMLFYKNIEQFTLKYF
jgi:hypothetical protein